MRTRQQIIDRARLADAQRARPVLLDFLTWEEAQPFLTEAVTLKFWNRKATPHLPARPRPLTKTELYGGLRLSYRKAWVHALAHSSVLVGAELLRLIEWAWLLEADPIVQGMAKDEWAFAPYGGPILLAMGTVFDLNLPSTWGQNMAMGMPCVAGCELCGSQIAAWKEGV
jgi:hypothetical protein